MMEVHYKSNIFYLSTSYFIKITLLVWTLYANYYSYELKNITIMNIRSVLTFGSFDEYFPA